MSHPKVPQQPVIVTAILKTIFVNQLNVIQRKKIHRILNAISWGVLMPAGVMFARYLKVSKAADRAWFYLHIACQTSAYIIGVDGWGTGLKLGSKSVWNTTGQDGWKRVYTGVIITVGALAVILELFTWVVVLRRKKNEVSN
ncbi:hypothetical protein QQ045_024435 [Rhodiola kirilowii]